jgi:predicted ATPase
MAADEGADQGGSGFAQVLRRSRLRANLTQEELAVRAAVGVRTVRDLERGRASRPQRTTVELLAAALGLAAAEREAFLSAARGQAPEEGLPPTAFLRLAPSVELVGRDEDLAELAASLEAADGPRGVTLVGIAGVGKTSLGFAVAHRVAGSYPGGVAGIVITDGASVGEIFGSIAAGFAVGRPDDLPGRFAGRPALLFVDAVERAPEAAAEMLAQLLARIPALRFLATGRHPVGLPAERVWPLAPLQTPPAEAGTTLAEISAYPSVGLFLERLGRVRRTALEPDEIAPLATLVRRLGGLPLAIELAAARSRVLTVPEILDRYGDRVLDLSRPGAGGPEAVVSLRDAVAASYRLLNSGEQHALRRLSMFRYRWSLGLAEQMSEGTQTDGADVVHLLDRLLELGLLSVRGSRTFRFRLLDVVRDYGAERAAAEGELLDGRHRHAELFAQLAQQIAPDLVGTNLFESASRLDDVAGDLGGALAFAAREEPAVALRIAAALPRWWRFRGRDVSGRQWLRRLLDDPRTADADPATRAWAKVGLAQLALEHGAGAEEIESAEAAVAEFEHLGSAPGQSTAHNLLASLWMTTGGYDQARRHGEAALALAQRSGKIRDMAVAENNLTWHEIREGDLPEARSEPPAATAGHDRAGTGRGGPVDRGRGGADAVAGLRRHHPGRAGRGGGSRDCGTAWGAEEGGRVLRSRRRRLRRSARSPGRGGGAGRTDREHARPGRAGGGGAPAGGTVPLGRDHAAGPGAESPRTGGCRPALSRPALSRPALSRPALSRPARALGSQGVRPTGVAWTAGKACPPRAGRRNAPPVNAARTMAPPSAPRRRLGRAASPLRREQ